MREGSCKEALGCSAPVAGKHECALCGKIYKFCKMHKPWATVCMNGHVLRTHPETVSDTKIDQILDNDEAMRGLQEERRRSPDLWEKLFARLEARKAARTQ
jgi:hypothetical protein